MNTKYTPGPWSKMNWGQTISINSKETMGIAHVNAGGNSDSGIPSVEDSANAALIVRAVNSHAELLEALKGYERMTQAILSADELDVADLKTALAFILPATQAAIAKATP